MTPPPLDNLFSTLPSPGAPEAFRTLLETAAFRLEQIVSHGQATEPGFWYDQPEAEWVALLQGTATLAFEDRYVDLRPGDHLLIPARQKHRVDRTSPDAVWLALHLRS